jgi:hypothetical protein
MTPLKKRESASLAKETQSTKNPLLAKMTSEPVTLENEDNWNSKINKKVLTVQK